MLHVMAEGDYVKAAKEAELRTLGPQLEALGRLAQDLELLFEIAHPVTHASECDMLRLVAVKYSQWEAMRTFIQSQVTAAGEEARRRWRAEH